MTTLTSEATCEGGRIVLDKPLPLSDGKIRIIVLREDTPLERKEDFLSLMRNSNATLNGWRFNRDDIHER